MTFEKIELDILDTEGKLQTGDLLRIFKRLLIQIW
jgi:hypothetical protein